MFTWFTLDTDDVRHLPKHQGHPTRSTQPFEGNPEELSAMFQTGWRAWLNWMETHDGAVTLFVISDLLETNAFPTMLSEALERFPTRLTVGCHGHTHRSWSAWGEDPEGFSSMLARSTSLLQQHAGEAFRPYFRAPNGYIAPWMAPLLAKHGYTVDSSVNPSWLVKHKAGGVAWSAVTLAMKQSGLKERPWVTRWGLPVNGPALFRFPLSRIAGGAWRSLPRMLTADEADTVSVADNLATVYCHVMDFARREGTWRPPFRRHKAK
jgi:peptidoglycan/xylan/chitin deacetylase (PgdA/CDA1 family)